jgi:hypothetical protein
VATKAAMMDAGVAWLMQLLCDQPVRGKHGSSRASAGSASAPPRPPRG